MIAGERAVRRAADMPVFECGYNTHFMKGRPVILAKINRLKENGKRKGNGNGKGNFTNRKGNVNNIEAVGKIKENAKPGVPM